MRLTSGHPFWPACDGFIHTYDPIDQSVLCDIAIIGGGITGSLMARAANDAGFQTVLVDGRNCGWGSTAATTALVQYEIDTHFSDLVKSVGRNSAIQAYQACRDAIDSLQEICKRVKSGKFTTVPSYYLASRPSHVKPLQEEYRERLELGLEVEWLSARQLKKLFDFPVEGAILSRVAATIDPFDLAHGVLRHGTENGMRVFARTKVDAITECADGVTIATHRGPTIKARWAVVAAGYESSEFLAHKPKVSLRNTYAFATEPIAQLAGWPTDAILWESARPYFYARMTLDKRAIFGGADIPYKSPLIRDRLAGRQLAKLEMKWHALFPRIPLEVALSWAGTFAETADGLPYVGFPSSQPRTFFALCYGGNGITYSVLAAEMLIAALRGQNHRCAEVFHFERE